MKNTIKLIEKQYKNSIVFETSQAVISIVFPCNNTAWRYEIACLEGNLIEDFERFSSLEDAENRVYYLLFNY